VRFQHWLPGLNTNICYLPQTSILLNDQVDFIIFWPVCYGPLKQATWFQYQTQLMNSVFRTFLHVFTALKEGRIDIQFLKYPHKGNTSLCTLLWKKTNKRKGGEKGRACQNTSCLSKNSPWLPTIRTLLLVTWTNRRIENCFGLNENRKNLASYCD